MIRGFAISLIFTKSSSLRSPPADLVKYILLKEDLWLINYHDKSKPLGLGKGERTLSWATHIELDNKMPTVDNIHQHLALVKPDWGARNAYSIIKIPAGEQVTFISGKAVKQLSEKGGKFLGGGYQIRLRDFNEKWIIETKDLKK